MKMEPTTAFVGTVQHTPLADFAYKLRHPETWPVGFEFDYLYEDTCARGLAAALGIITEPTTGEMMAAFGLSAKVARQLFNAGWAAVYLGKGVVPAAMIADRIDAHLGVTSAH